MKRGDAAEQAAWLRSPGFKPDNAANVSKDGSLNNNGNNVNNNNAVRPALPAMCQDPAACAAERAAGKGAAFPSARSGKHMPAVSLTPWLWALRAVKDSFTASAGRRTLHD